MKPTIDRYEVHLKDRLYSLETTLKAATALILLALCATATNAVANIMSLLNDYPAWPPALACLASGIITAALIVARGRTRAEYRRISIQLDTVRRYRRYRRDVQIHVQPKHVNDDRVDSILYAVTALNKGRHL